MDEAEQKLLPPVKIELPPEFGSLARRLDTGIDRTIELAWWDGARTGAGTVLLLAIVAVIFWRMLRG